MISYFGAKSKMSKWIYNYIPKDIKTFAEPFSGAMWVYTTIGLDYSNIKNIIYNDYNKHMANLFACLKEHKTFLSKIENEIENGFLKTDKIDEEYKQFHKDIFYSYKHDKSSTNFLDNPPINIPDFDAGVKYAFLLTSTFNGVFPRSGGYSGISGNNKIKLYALINKLKKKEYQDKLSKITNIHSLDFEELIKKYDSKDTFFYLDPPYFSSDEDGNDTGKRASWYGVKDSFNQQTHIRLLELLKTTKSRWALSYYYFPELENHLPRDKYVWLEKDFFRSSASFSETKDTKGTELLILNYDPKFIGNNTPTSEKLIDEIEEENDGAFINSDIDKSEIIEEFTHKLISSQKDIEPDIQEVVNDVFWDLIPEKEVEVKPVVKPEEEIDDFWNS